MVWVTAWEQLHAGKSTCETAFARHVITNHLDKRCSPVIEVDGQEGIREVPCVAGSVRQHMQTPMLLIGSFDRKDWGGAFSYMQYFAQAAIPSIGFLHFELIVRPYGASSRQ